jgi:ferric-dicitrate binding protein FerR (iron transport regulator)
MPEIDSLIQKYLQKETNDVEDQLLHQWIHESPENEKRFFGEKDIWDTLGVHSNQKAYETDLELELLRSRISTNQSKNTRYFIQFIRVAALLLIAFGLGWSTQFISLTKDQSVAAVTMQEIFVPKGQVNQLFLADGTRIWINSETRIVAPSQFSSNERVVKLSGEAFFEVAKDKNRPFKVEVNGQQIEVLGTSFNVRAYANSNEIETTLETGQIRLQTGSQITLLKPGEQSVFNKTTNKLTIANVDPLTASAWKSGRYEFQNKELLEVFKLVERLYDVEFTMDEAYFKGMHFSGVIKRNKDARHFLELLNHSVPIKYEITSDKILITHK